MNTPLPKPKKIRLTIPVTPEVHEAFQRIGKATSMPTGRAMGEWLGDTLDAAQYLAETLEKARAAPKLVAQQLHAYALGLTDETGALMARMREGGLGASTGHAQRGREGSPDPLTPPGSNKGGKVLKNTKKPSGPKA
jgi:hypothetical protein